MSFHDRILDIRGTYSRGHFLNRWRNMRDLVFERDRQCSIPRVSVIGSIMPAVPQAPLHHHVAGLTDEQCRYLRLHARTVDPPMQWRWLMQDSYCRAATTHGRIATISAGNVCDLIERGFMEAVGEYGQGITDKGRTAL
jgi:hypothetical protein